MLDEVAAERDVALQKPAHALVIHEQQHQVDALSADLKTDAPLAQHEERRSTPSAFVPAAGEALAVLAAEDERGFLHTGNDRDTLGLGPQIVGNPAVGRNLKLLQHFGCLFDPLDQVRIGCRSA